MMIDLLSKYLLPPGKKTPLAGTGGEIQSGVRPRRSKPAARAVQPSCAKYDLQVDRHHGLNSP
jgi:hypothetical protein